MKNLKMGLWSVLILSLTLLGTNSYAEVDRGAGVPVETLPKELTGLEIKDYFAPTDLKKVGVIHALSGNMVVIHRDTKEAYFGRAGDTIYENDSLNTLADSRCRIKFFDEDVVTMAAETEFSVDSYEDQRKVGKKRSLFSMVKGKAMFYAMRLFRYKETRFRLKTPTVTVGVRGTKFGAHVYWVDEEKRADAGIEVADKGDEVGIYLAAADPGAGTSYTDCHSEDGIVEIEEEGKVIGPGEMYRGETRDVIPTPPEVVSAFDQETSVETKAEAEAEEAAIEGLVADTGEANILEAVAEIMEEVSNITEQETGSKTETEATPPTQTRPKTSYGYFSGMLVETNGADWLARIYISNTRQNFDSAYVKAYGLPPNGTDFIKADDIEGQPMHAKEAVFGGNSSGTLEASYTISDTEIGYNSYQEWGYWTMTTKFSISGNDYYFDNKGWWIYGDPTCDDKVAGFHGSVNYSGEAWGTFFTAGTGDDMTGTFNCGVNFDTDSISTFNMSVSSANHSAAIENASGSFASSHFNIDTGTGTWKLDGATGAYDKGAHGSLYGPNGEYIGGVWGICKDSSHGATGIFQGSK
ncbi:MAG: FecR domain-containing protein [Deltaproteobacteria bacterium]|nr:FecR domain-containing protein [Deltaproteobacteria bacterium]